MLNFRLGTTNLTSASIATNGDARTFPRINFTREIPRAHTHSLALDVVLTSDGAGRGLGDRWTVDHRSKRRPAYNKNSPKTSCIWRVPYLDSWGVLYLVSWTGKMIKIFQFFHLHS